MRDRIDRVAARSRRRAARPSTASLPGALAQHREQAHVDEHAADAMRRRRLRRRTSRSSAARESTAAPSAAAARRPSRCRSRCRRGRRVAVESDAVHAPVAARVALGAQARRCPASRAAACIGSRADRLVLRDGSDRRASTGSPSGSVRADSVTRHEACGCGGHSDAGRGARRREQSGGRLASGCQSSLEPDRPGPTCMISRRPIRIRRRTVRSAQSRVVRARGKRDLRAVRRPGRSCVGDAVVCVDRERVASEPSGLIV